MRPSDHHNPDKVARLVSERTAVINQSRALLLERGIIVRQGPQERSYETRLTKAATTIE
jgi:hypothetical protein